MKLTAQVRDILFLISKVQNVVPAKPVIPILTNILLEAKGKEITLSATDLTVSVQVSTPAIIKEEGTITLPAKRFFSLVREITAPEISIESFDSDVIISAPGGSHFRLHSIDKNEFPTFPELSGGELLNIEPKELKRLFTKTSFATAKDDSRQVLNGVYIRIENNRIISVGTDGKKLAKMEALLLKPSSSIHEMIIPLKAVDEFIRILENDETVSMTLMDDKVAIETGHVLLITKLLQGKYPDYERVIPSYDTIKVVSLHKDELVSLLKQVSLFTSTENHSVKFTFQKGLVELEANNAKVGEGKVNMPVDYAGDEIKIAFNPLYFIDILRHCEEETVGLGITDSHNPGSIKSEDTKNHFVLMPMRLSGE